MIKHCIVSISSPPTGHPIVPFNAYHEAVEKILSDFFDTSASAYIFAKKMNDSICLIVRRNCDGNRSATLPSVKCHNL